MGLGFGGLYNLRRIITYRLSPFEQRAYAGVLEHGIPNIARRCAESFPYVVPPLALGVLAYYQIERLHELYMRKNPDDYKDDC